MDTHDSLVKTRYHLSRTFQSASTSVMSIDILLFCAQSETSNILPVSDFQLCILCKVICLGRGKIIVQSTNQASTLLPIDLMLTDSIKVFTVMSTCQF